MSDADWLSYCHVTLQWTTHLLAFSQFFSADSELYALVLSIIIELPLTKSTVQLLAELFSDADDLEPAVQDQLDNLLREWQGVFVSDAAVGQKNQSSKPSRKKTLSFLYHQTSHSVQMSVCKKTRLFGEYYTQVFVYQDQEMGEGTMPCVGSWPHESEVEFIQFLDMFYEVCFKRLVEMETSDVPLLLKFSATIQQSNLGTPAENVTENRVVSSPPPRTAQPIITGNLI